MKIDVAMECSGRFTKRDDAAKHLTAGAKKVLISAPATDEDITVVYGVTTTSLRRRMPSSPTLPVPPTAWLQWLDCQNFLGIDIWLHD